MNIADFKQAVERHWRHHAPCAHLLWMRDGDEELQIEVAPIFQEIVGGKQDGDRVWSGFRFDVSGFLDECGVLLEGVLAASYCTECTETPYVGIRGTYFGTRFSLRVHLEPIAGTAPVEIIDVLKNETRAIGESQP